MPKWSDYIRNLGTAGPATIEGIKALGFALTSEIPGLVAKYVRVDAAQSFTSGEQLQGRDNIGLGTVATQNADDVAISGGEISGLDTPLAVADGGTGATDAEAARDNLGLGNVDNTSDADKPVSTATQTALDDKQNRESPPQMVGQVAFFAMNTAPTGWLKADGTDVSRTTYAALFAAIGTTFGEGDGSTTFSLPDLRGEFLRAWDDGRGVDVDRDFGSTQAQAIQMHSHSVGFNANSNNFHGTKSVTSANAYVVTATASASRNNGTSSEGGTETRPRNVALLACIRH